MSFLVENFGMLLELGSVIPGGGMIADAHNVTDDCSGGSGGLIRLKARKVGVCSPVLCGLTVHLDML